MAADHHPDVLLVRKHLVEHLGQPEEVFEISGSPIPGSPVQSLNLAYFAPSGPQLPVVFATCGASLYKMADGRRVEALIILRREPDAAGFEGVNKLLGSFALFAESTGQAVRLGDVVRAPQELKSFCSMDALLFLPPVPFVPNFHQLQVTRDERVELVWLLPVYEAEADYALRHGPQTLMMLFAAQSLDLTDPERGEANTMLSPEDAAGMAQRATLESQKRSGEQAQGPILPVGKTKTARRNVGRGSFDVEEGDTVIITRRPKAPREPGSAPTEIAPEPTQTQVQAGAVSETRVDAKAVPRTASAKIDPKRRPWVVGPEPKNEVRFDLTGSPAKAPRPSSPEAPAPAPVRESPDAAKKKRFEELKANAKAAAARAATRKADRAQAAAEPSVASSAPTPHPGPGLAPGPGRRVTEAAARRRGAPSPVIKGQPKRPNED